jgi:UDP-glucose 4-epimerase
LELIKSFEKVSGVSVNFQYKARRAGDLHEFWVDSSRACLLLNWHPKFSVNQMCEDAWRWQSNNLNGYNENNITINNFDNLKKEGSNSDEN